MGRGPKPSPLPGVVQTPVRPGRVLWHPGMKAAATRPRSPGMCQALGFLLPAPAPCQRGDSGSGRLVTHHEIIGPAAFLPHQYFSLERREKRSSGSFSSRFFGPDQQVFAPPLYLLLQYINFTSLLSPRLPYFFFIILQPWEGPAGIAGSWKPSRGFSSPWQGQRQDRQTEGRTDGQTDSLPGPPGLRHLSGCCGAAPSRASSHLPWDVTQFPRRVELLPASTAPFFFCGAASEGEGGLGWFKRGEECW